MITNYPKDEVESWPKQEAEARAWLNDPAPPRPGWMERPQAEE
jgi:hypothetical protein